MSSHNCRIGKITDRQGRFIAKIIHTRPEGVVEIEIGEMAGEVNTIGELYKLLPYHTGLRRLRTMPYRWQIQAWEERKELPERTLPTILGEVNTK